MTWETVIGLEVHVQLKTRSKMFCGCSADFGSRPNTNVCPVCLGLPGALPIPNERAVRLAVRAALSLGATVHDTSVFARKHYFYPDLPKGYQISQFSEPLATGGALDIGTSSPRPIGITRLHLEEDAGKSMHDRVPGMTAVDLNRCGIPLIEIVSEPDLRSPAQARRYLAALKQVLEYLEVSDCNMEEGSLRVDANVSVRRPGDVLGVKQEIKNMNSFAAVERSLAQLRDQQVRTVEAGGTIQLTTYSAATGALRPLRVKEESHDYRYFPDPDLPALVLSWFGVDVASERHDLPELPGPKRARLCAQYGVAQTDADVLSGSVALADYFEAVVGAGADPKRAAHWVMGPVLADVKASSLGFRVEPARLAALEQLVADGTLSNQAAKKVFARLAETGGDPHTVAGRMGLLQVSDRDQVEAWVDQVLTECAAETTRYREGEQKLLGFLVGQVMKRSGGRADPKLARTIVRERATEPE